MYVCGMTVYDYCHMGHARVLVMFDVITRHLRRHFPKVEYVRNITDIDDKIIKRAVENKEDIYSLTNRFIEAMHEDERALGVLPPDVEPRATDAIDQMFYMIEALIEKGIAYQGKSGDVYYSVRDFKGYGKLSGKNLDELEAGARVDIETDKRDPLDFVLWKMAKPSEPSWSSPWGDGRPGWHIECSAMCKEHLGDVIDIHCGGRDLVFPHHENEVAQSCCSNNTEKFANYWVHNGMINMDNQKMSKSLGNILLIKDVVEKYKGEVIRWLLLSAQYRQSVNWSKDSIHKAQKTMDRIYATLRDNQSVEAEINKDAIPSSIILALDDDLNTPMAFAEINKLAKQLAKAESKEEKQLYKSQLLSTGHLLGLFQQDSETWFKSDNNEINNEKVEELILLRKQAREDKDWEKSDLIRDELASMNIVLEDSPEGTRWCIKK